MLFVVRDLHRIYFEIVKTKRLTDGDQFKGHALFETHILDRIHMFYSDLVATMKGLHPPCAGKLPSVG